MPVKRVSYNVLVIEDNPGDATLIEDFLLEQMDSVRITISTSFKAAKNLLSQVDCEFDIVLLDLSLPDKTGVELLDEIVLMCKELPIIVLTGYADLEFGVKSLSLGASDYILKDELTSINLYKGILYSFERKRIIHSLTLSEKRYETVARYSINILI